MVTINNTSKTNPKNKGFADSVQSLDFPNGALGRNRTGTELPPTDFKSAASTCSATSASHFKNLIQTKKYKCNIKLVFLLFMATLFKV